MASTQMIGKTHLTLLSRANPSWFQRVVRVLFHCIHTNRAAVSCLFVALFTPALFWIASNNSLYHLPPFSWCDVGSHTSSGDSSPNSQCRTCNGTGYWLTSSQGHQSIIIAVVYQFLCQKSIKVTLSLSSISATCKCKPRVDNSHSKERHVHTLWPVNIKMSISSLTFFDSPLLCL